MYVCEFTIRITPKEQERATPWHLRPPSIKAVLFDVDLTPIQTNGQSLLMYKPYTDQIFGLGQELDSIQKWKQYELNMRGLKILKSIARENHPQISWPILAELVATMVPSKDVLLIIASPAFQLLLKYMELIVEFLEECNFRWDTYLKFATYLASI